MDQAAFSDMLLTERRKLGLSLDQASSTTRVRKRFLEAFEAGDFDSMPPIGYARNMVASYSRFLGLDANAVLDAFDRDYARWQRSHPERENTHSYNTTAISGGETAQQQQQRMQQQQQQRSQTQPARRTVPTQHQRSLSRDTSSTDNTTPTSLPRRFPATSPSRDIDENRRTPRYPKALNGEDDRRRDRSEETARRQAVSHNSYASSNKRAAEIKGNGSYSIFHSEKNSHRKFIVIAIIVALVLLVVIIRGVVSCTSKPVTTDTTTPITGVNDEPTQTTSTTSAAITTQTGEVTSSTTTTTPFTVAFSLSENTTSDIYLVIDGQVAYSGTAVGPDSQSFEATQTAQMTIGNPEAVTVTKNGTAVDISVQADGSGTVDLKAD